MANPLGVDVGQRAEKLVDVDLDFQDRHRGLHLVEETRGTVNGLWDKFEYQVQVDLVFLDFQSSVSSILGTCQSCSSHLHVLRWSSKKL